MSETVSTWKPLFATCCLFSSSGHRQRKYETNNFYIVLEKQHQLDKEVYRIVQKTKPKRKTK